MGMVTSLLTAGPHGPTPFSNVTAAFTHKEWRHLVQAPREGFEEIPEKSRNLVLGLPVSQPGMNSQLEQGKSPWMLEGEGLRSTCPAPGATQLTRGSLQPASASSCPSKVVLAWLTPAPTAALGSEVASPLDSSQPDSTHTSAKMVPAQPAPGSCGSHPPQLKLQAPV